MKDKLDSSNNFNLQNQENQVLTSIKLLADQLEEAWAKAQDINAPYECHICTHVIVCGMGGSALPARIIQSAFKSSLREPLLLNTNFSLPHFIGPQSLVVISSYSGNTAEALSCLHKAQSAGAKIFGITTGGRLAEEINAGLPGIIIDTPNNPSKQPRFGLGLSIGALLAILSSCQFVSLTELELQNALKTMRQTLSDCAPDKKTEINPAKILSIKFQEQAPIIIASGHLLGAAHAMKNQLNETAKTFSVHFDLPELNHHLMEGLKYPALLKQNLRFLFLESDLYVDELKKRYSLTREVVEKNEISTEILNLNSESKFSQALEVVALGSYLSFYLSFLHGEDPAQIPWVEFFKKRLQ